MATRIHRTTAKPTGWASGSNKVISDSDECCDLRARKSESGRGWIESKILVERFVGEFVKVREFFRNDDESVVVFFVGNGKTTNCPLHIERRVCRSWRNELTGVDRRKIGQDSIEVLTQRGDLLFFKFERNASAGIAGLNEEGSSSGFAKDTGNDKVGIHELPGFAHEIPNFERSSPVELTVSTAGPDDV